MHGAVSPDGTKISFDLGPLAVDGKVDVALQPGAGGTPVPAVPVPGAPAPPSADGFDITFEPVAADQVAVSPGLASNESSTPSDALPSVPESSAPFSSDVGNADTDIEDYIIDKVAAGTQGRAHVDATLGNQKGSADATCIFS